LIHPLEEKRADDTLLEGKKLGVEVLKREQTDLSSYFNLMQIARFSTHSFKKLYAIGFHGLLTPSIYTCSASTLN
jgi:hypothetical protein